MGLDKVDKRLWQTAVKTVRPFPLNSPAAKLIVGVSGGADSLVLLHLLWRQLGAAQLVAVHLNHGLRPEADADAEFVAETAAAWQIPFIHQKVDIAEVAGKFHLSLEAAGRLARYRFFAEQVAENKATAVTVAHHADDQAETVLLNLLRGSGSLGLRGMLTVTNLPDAPEWTLLRPFLHITRQEIEAYCTKHNLQPRHDGSNEDTKFTRNRIRHELLPLLKSYNPQISARLQQLATITADEQAWLHEQFAAVWPDLLTAESKSGLSFSRQTFVALPTAWQRLVLRKAVQQLRPFPTEISFQTIEQARLLILDKQSGTVVSLPGGLLMRVEAREVAFGDITEQRPAVAPQLDLERPVRLPVPGRLDFKNGWYIEATPRSDIVLRDVQQNQDRWQAFVTVAEREPLWLRPSHPGERFQPLGLGGHSQAIQDLLSDRKVTRGKRPLWPIVATESHPAWIVGLHLDERVRVTEQSPHIVQLICKPNPTPKSR